MREVATQRFAVGATNPRGKVSWGAKISDGRVWRSSPTQVAARCQRVRACWSAAEQQAAPCNLRPLANSVVTVGFHFGPRQSRSGLVRVDAGPNTDVAAQLPFR
jgi:hypothetical protein